MTPYTDTTKLYHASVESSSWYDENRLDSVRYKFPAFYGWIYDGEYFLDKTPEDSIKFGTVTSKPYHLWSIQPCDGGDLNDLILAVDNAKRDLQSFYSFDLPPRSCVFGNHGEVVFRHEHEHCFFGREPLPSHPAELNQRVVRCVFHLENDKNGNIFPSITGVELMPRGFPFTDEDEVTDCNESTFKDW